MIPARGHITTVSEHFENELDMIDATERTRFSVHTGVVGLAVEHH
jgi:hypothetical protein